MSGSYFALNSKYNTLLALINAIPIPSPPLPPTADIMTTNTAQTVTAIKTFSVLPQSAVVPTLGDQLVNKTYADATADNTTLQQVLTAGNTATGANATIGLTNSGVGYTTNPQLTLNNSNATVGTTTGVPSVETFKSGRNGVAGDIIYAQAHFAKNFLGNKTEFARIEASVRNTGAGNDDGSIGFSGLINGVQTEFFRVNGADSENNMFLPLDMNNQSIKTSTGSLNLSATGSSGTGQILLAPKSVSNIRLAGDVIIDANETLFLTTSPNPITTTLGAGTLVINNTTNFTSANILSTEITILDTASASPDTIYGQLAATGCAISRTNPTSGYQYNLLLNNDSANGGELQWSNTDPLSTYPLIIDTNKSLRMKITDDFELEGVNIEANTAGATSGQYLRIKLNGVFYKIDLLADV